jgi:ATP-dependent DNA ligase
MLAERGLPRGDLAGWAAEPKLDGWRAIVVVDPSLPNGVSVRTRRGHSIMEAVPGIASLAELGHRVVLDGELARSLTTESLRQTFLRSEHVEGIRRAIGST